MSDLSVPELQNAIVTQIPEVLDFELLDRIYQVLSHDTVKQKIEAALSITTRDANIGNTDSIIDDMLGSIANVPGSSHEKLEFVQALEQGNAVDIAQLTSPASTFDKIFPTPFTERFFQANANFGRGIKMKGPGEFALAIMAPAISLAEKGDIMIGDQHVEVKSAERSQAGGRLGEVGPAQLPEIVSELTKVAAKYLNTPEQTALFQSEFLTVKSKSLTRSIQALHTVFDGDAVAIADCVASVVVLSFPSPMSIAIGKAAAMDSTGHKAEIEYMKQNFEWYKARDGFDSIMAIWFPGKKVFNMNTGDDMVALREAGKIGASSVSFLPSKPNEVYAQINFLKTQK
jgi:hypothetical protein